MIGLSGDRTTGLSGDFRTNALSATADGLLLAATASGASSAVARLTED